MHSQKNEEKGKNYELKNKPTKKLVTCIWWYKQFTALLWIQNNFVEHKNLKEFVWTS